MSLEINITKELELLSKDKTYIKQIIKIANQNWSKHTIQIKELMESILDHIEGKYGEQDTEYDEVYVKTIICMAWYYLTFSKYEKGTVHILKAYEICKRNRLNRDKMRLCNILLVIYMKQGLFEKALEYGIEGIELAKRHHDVKSEATLILNMMQLYIELKEYQKALELVEYLEQLEYQKDEKHLLFIESALAEIKLHTHDIYGAMVHCDKAYIHALDQEDTNALAEILCIRGQIQMRYNKFKDASEDFRRGTQISERNNYKELIIRGIISWSKEKLELDVTDEVEEKLIEAIKLADEINMVHLKVQAYEYLEKLYHKMDKWKEAYHTIKAKDECIKQWYMYEGDSLWLEKLEQKNTSHELKVYKKLYQQIKKISKVGQSFTANLEIDEMIDMVYEQVRELMPVDMVGLGMRKKNGEYMYKTYGPAGEIISSDEDRYNNAICLGNMALEVEDDILINNGDYSKYFNICKKDNLVQDYIQSAMLTKLKIDDEPFGVIGIGHYKKEAYTKNDLRSLQILSSYLAVALRNAELFNEVEYLAMYDALTGIYNRGAVLNLGKEQFVKNNALGKPTAIIMLDIDYFKTINDQYGHVFGDKVLAKIGQILTKSIRNVDILGRYGGEEFIVVLNDVDLEGSQKIAERIKQNIENYKFVTYQNQEITITTSCGLYLCQGESSFEAGIKKADDSLYRAKALGRNRIVVYNEDEQ